MSRPRKSNVTEEKLTATTEKGDIDFVKERASVPSVEIPAVDVDPSYPPEDDEEEIEMTEEERAAMLNRINIDRGEKNVSKVLMSEELVPFTIPEDNSISGNQIWECSFNGLILRFKRGVEYMQPRYIVEFVNSRIAIQRESDDKLSVFTNGAGVKLNF